MQIDEPATVRRVASTPHPFVMGINYWPRGKAMYWWKEFDGGEVKEEFAEIAELGARVVRIFLMWEDFQPEPWVLSLHQLDNLGLVLDAAAAVHLSVMPTFLTGNMSGIFWLPPWSLTEEPKATSGLQMVAGKYSDRQVRDLFGDPFMLRAQLFHVRGIASTFATHPALFGWDLANELDEVRNPRSYDGGWLWSYMLCEEIRKIDSTHTVTYGAHTPSLSRINGLSVSDLAETNDYLSMHGYPLYSDLARGPLDADFVPFMNALAESLGPKPVLFQEFGLCTAAPDEAGHYIEDEFLGQKKQQYMASEEEAGKYYREVLEKLYRAGSLGAFAWCFSDYDPRLWDRPPFDRALRERTFGLTRADGSVKPSGVEFQQFATRMRAGTERGWGSERVVFPVTDDQYYQDPATHFQEMYRWYLAKKAGRGDSGTR